MARVSPSLTPPGPIGRSHPICIRHTSADDIDCVGDTKLKSRRKVNDVGVAIPNGDTSLAARELSFLVRLAQAAAAAQRPDELLDLIIREATSAIGTDVCSLYLLTSRGRLSQ